jgi:hypothetical protein
MLLSWPGFRGPFERVVVRNSVPAVAGDHVLVRCDLAEEIDIDAMIACRGAGLSAGLRQLCPSDPANLRFRALPGQGRRRHRR